MELVPGFIWLPYRQWLEWRVPRNSMESATLSRRANDVDGCKSADNYITLLSKGDV
jgi:hypothetical protein